LRVVTNLKELLILHEGRLAVPYKDSLGYWTAGVGHLIDRRRGGSLHPSWKAFPLTDDEIDEALDSDITRKSVGLFGALPWVMGLDDVRKAVLTDMAFNLGIAGLLQFKNTLAAVKERRWEDAALGMLASRWADQVGARASRLADMMRTGRWPDVFVGPY
jgi:lysozyme